MYTCLGIFIYLKRMCICISQESVTPRRLSLSTTGRGYAHPVLKRPHLDTGSEVHVEGATDNEIVNAKSSDHRWSDGPTSKY